MEKNASLRFVCDPRDYEEVDLQFEWNEDLTFSELVSFFKRFCIAMSYAPETVEKLDDEE